MKLSRRGVSADTATDTDVEPSSTDGDDGGINLRKTTDVAKGRPTPKRRDAEGRKGPVTAPKTRKEAYARQKQLTKEQKASPAAGKAPVKARSAAEQRAALKRGDADALPRRDQGKTRKLARDYVDSTRMLSNYMLWLFPLFIVTTIVPALRILELAVIVIFLGLVVEWFIVGRRLRAIALERFGEADGTNMGIGFYMGSRAYMPRKWRLPAPQLTRGQEY